MNFLRRLSERFDRHIELPYLGHCPAHDIVLLKDGSLLTMAALRGMPHELVSDMERAGIAGFLNTLWRQIGGNDTVTLGLHLTSTKTTAHLTSPKFHNEFAAAFDRDYRTHILAKLFNKSWLISILVSPRLALGNQKEYSREIESFFNRFHKPEIDSHQVDVLANAWLTISKTLSEYGVRRLGVRSDDRGMLFSEIAQALRRILTARDVPVGLFDGPLGYSVYTDRAVFEPRHYRLLTPGGVRWGTLFGLQEYMASTVPSMFDSILQLQMEFVLTQTIGFMPRQQSITRLRRKQNQLFTANDPAFAQTAEIDDAVSELGGGEVRRGLNHWSLAVYGDSYPELDRNRGEAYLALAHSGAVVTEETWGNEAAYFAQLPGVFNFRTRPGAISTRNLAHMAGLGAFPAGSTAGRWGNAIIQLRTIGGTVYDYIPHVDDVGMTAVFGRTGSGKTTWLNVILMMLDQCIGANGFIFRFGKDRDGELLAYAVDGLHLDIRSGEDSGLAPLLGLQNTPADRDFLVRWIKALCLSDGHGPLPPQDDARLARGVQAIMRMPLGLRSLEGLRQFLSWRDPMGAGARLDRWCRGNALGWAFDGERDLSIIPKIIGGVRYVGIDLTAIFDNPEVLNPAAVYLLYCLSTLIDGRRVVGALDECQAYVLHPLMRGMIDDFLRRGRKNNMVLYLSTQQPEDFLTDEDDTFATTMIEQCFTKIAFRNDTANKDTWCGKMKYTEGEFMAISEKMLPGSRQCLIKRSDGSAIIDFDLSKISKYVGILSARKSTVRYAETLRQQTSDWVPKFMDTYETAARD